VVLGVPDLPLEPFEPVFPVVFVGVGVGVGFGIVYFSFYYM
jgi:hypothetical protein